MASAACPEIDADLLQRARRGDRDAHAALYAAFAPMVFTLARRMLGSTAQAEDILQDSFVEVIRNAAQYRGDAAVGSWIKRIAVNKCLSHLRSPWVARQDRYRDENAADSADAAEQPAMSDARAEADPATQVELLRALDRLPDTARAVVWLHDVEGYTHAEIAACMGRSTSFSKSQLMRAYQQLRTALAPEPDPGAQPGAASGGGRTETATAAGADLNNGESRPCMALKTV